ncbi:MAG: DUF6273 domain-containing protein, partial [Oscillospiraceae bacterium]|nr:DUF6273 domain-containing protein [Oscillospiraceae bacterium]
MIILLAWIVTWLKTPAPVSAPGGQSSYEVLEKDNNGEPLVVKFGSSRWKVLEHRNSRLLLIREDIWTELPYNEKNKNVTWETCTLRGYLNGEFYESFSEADRAKIVETTVKTPDSGYTAADGTTWSAPGGNET